jgi:hypothetical protein
MLALIVLVVPASWAEEAAADAVTTTTIPGHNRGYGPPPNDPRDLPTGLPGFGSPGQKPSADEQRSRSCAADRDAPELSAARGSVEEVPAVHVERLPGAAA